MYKNVIKNQNMDKNKWNKCNVWKHIWTIVMGWYRNIGDMIICMKTIVWNIKCEQQMWNHMWTTNEWMKVYEM
jgi:hypothetical protein